MTWIGYVLAFMCGQALFLLKRMALAVRSPMNALRSRRQYLAQNWDILLYRGAIEYAFLFFYLHQPLLAQLAGIAHVKLPFVIPVFGFGCFSLGLMCDFAMDWIAMQDKVLGIPVPSWIKEFVPRIPELEIVVATIQVNGGKLQTSATDQCAVDPRSLTPEPKTDSVPPVPRNPKLGGG